MTSILVLEFLSAGGLHGDPAEAVLMPLGVSMRDAMAADLLALPGADLRVTVADCSAAPAEALAARLPPAQAARLHRTRAHPGQTLLDFLGEQAGAHDLAWVVAPETGELLPRCRERVGDARWLGSGADAQHAAARKSRTLARLAAAGLPVPDDLAAEARRWVVKPDDGAGAVDTVVLADRAAAQRLAARRAAAGEPVILQPWVESADSADDQACSLSMLCGPGLPGGAEPLALNRQRIRVDAAGQVHFDGIERLATDPADPRWPALQALASRIAAAMPGLCGFVGVDLVRHARLGWVPIEVNARVSCAWVGLSAALGRPLAAEVLALHRRARTAAAAGMSREASDAAV
jgi:predicted ATP-grasp superfamily ATP-dependent carboligase